MFDLIDVSSRTDERLYFKRDLPPIGALIHTTDGVDSLNYLQGGVLREGRVASADYLIVRTGKIYRITPDGNASYHAGRCRWKGLIDSTNITSAKLVGIELENYDRGTQVPTDAQHYALAALLLHLAHLYNWSPLHVYGHGSLADPVGRRTDPRGLDWGHVFWLMEFMPRQLTLNKQKGG